MIYYNGLDSANSYCQFNLGINHRYYHGLNSIANILAISICVIRSAE